MYMPTKKYKRKNAKKIMLNGSNCSQKSQLSEILTEPLNPRKIRLSNANLQKLHTYTSLANEQFV